MSHYAIIGDNNIVEQVIYYDNSVNETDIEEYLESQGLFAVRTSYRTSGGVHSGGGIPLRKNYAGIGYFYDEVRDAFIPPKPYESWILNEESCMWESPISKPDDYDSPEKKYYWDEENLKWSEM